MNRPLRLAVLLALLAAAVPAPARAASDPGFSLSVASTFAKAVDLHAIGLAAVQDDGRLKTFDSLARERLKIVNASRALSAIDPVLLYLDMMLVPEHYASANVIWIKKPLIRVQVVQGIKTLVPPEQRAGLLAESELARIEKSGLVSPQFLDQPTVRTVLGTLQRDLMRTSKEIDALDAARSYSDAGVLASLWRVVPPIGGAPNDPWLTLDMALSNGFRGMPAGHPGMGGGAMPAAQRTTLLPGAGRTVSPELAASLGKAWQDLRTAWRFQDAAGATAALNTIAQGLALIEPALYPPLVRRAWEHWYYANDKLTITWLVYFAALPFLLMAAVYRFRWARVIGLALFGTGFALHTFSIVLRWWLAGRIPNANMFEAVTASAWFGGAAALVLELALRRWPVKNLPALSASTYAMTAMMLGHFMPITLNSDIGTVMPVLDRTIWLYIHTNMVIASYALIFFGSVTGALYLVGRLATHYVPSPRLAMAWNGAGGTGAVRGGAGSLILGRGLAPNDPDRTGLAKTLDGATMIFLELAFVTLWVGTILGAVWAYFSWGRPWGWDPKEVFALNTWLVFLVLVHVRFKVKDKALWTAVLAVLGCLVMIFNWVAVNFVIVGLHSYA